jgi:hypothetical protein
MSEMNLQEIIEGLRDGVEEDMRRIANKIFLTKGADSAILSVMEEAIDDGTFESWPMSLGLANYLEDIQNGTSV